LRDRLARAQPGGNAADRQIRDRLNEPTAAS